MGARSGLAQGSDAAPVKEPAPFASLVVECLVGNTGDKVLIRVRADDLVGKRTVAVQGCEFVGRHLQLVVPPGFKRVRHGGLLALAAKTRRLALAGELLTTQAASPQAAEDAQAFMRRVAAVEIDTCPHCRVGR